MRFSRSILAAHAVTLSVASMLLSDRLAQAADHKPSDTDTTLATPFVFVVQCARDTMNGPELLKVYAKPDGTTLFADLVNNVFSPDVSFISPRRNESDFEYAFTPPSSYLADDFPVTSRGARLNRTDLTLYVDYTPVGYSYTCTKIANDATATADFNGFVTAAATAAADKAQKENQKRERALPDRQL
jgi:hypothetical protein